MDTIILISTIAGFHFLGVISPGPSFLISLKRGLASSRQAGVLNALGVGSGMLVHSLMGCLGLSVLMAHLSWMYLVLKILGAGYLVFLGFRSIFFSKGRALGRRNLDGSNKNFTDRNAFRVGFLTALFNPKAIVYFLALFTTIVPPDAGAFVKLIIVMLLPTISFSWHLLIASLFSQPSFRRFYESHYRKAERVFGVLVIALGLKMGFSE